MKEELVEIGKDFTLSGILAEPRALDADKPVVVILNSGIMHRVGTCRTSVRLSRKLQTEGYVVLRFDLSGIGDSNARTVSMESGQRIIEEISATLDFLEQRYGIRRFVCYGLCSGAQNSFQAALQDERIVGLAGIDCYAYKTRRFKQIANRNRLLRPRAWLTAVKISSRVVLDRITGKTNAPDAPDDSIWTYPPRESVESGYNKLVNRGVKFMYLYTSTWIEQYNYREQFFDMYPSVDFGELLTLIHNTELSHILLEPNSQAYMLETVSQWIKTQAWS